MPFLLKFSQSWLSSNRHCCAWIYDAIRQGNQKEQDEATEFLSGAFLTALMLIGGILVSQFNSVIKPVIILTSVIMSTAGVLIGLMVFQMPFGIINTGVGIISLAGIVVNNAIILIDYIDILRNRDGMNRRRLWFRVARRALVTCGFTALTTALGMVPLAIGLNFDFFGLYGSLAPELYWGGMRGGMVGTNGRGDYRRDLVRHVFDTRPGPRSMR